ncbi:MAG TPA: restriction endonuclease [Bacillota bacterium]|nr:restriction endonuclease [Bacillota bacterium]
MEKPNVADYGLTEKEIEKLKKRDADAKKALFIVTVVVTAAYSVCQAVNDTDSVRLVLYTVPFYGFLGMVGGAMLGAVMIAVYSSLADLFHPGFARLKKYEEAKTRYEEPLIRQKIDFWRGLTGGEAVRELAGLFEKSGYRVAGNSPADNKGADLFLEKEGRTSIVKCAVREKPVESGTAAELYGTLVNSGADEAILVSLSGFTRGARRYARGKPVTLMDLPDVILMQEGLSAGGRD